MQDKLTPSEQLGDLLRQAGDNDAALSAYQKANVPHKVIEGLAAKGDFTELSRFSASQVRHSERQIWNSAQHALLPLHCIWHLGLDTAGQLSRLVLGWLQGYKPDYMYLLQRMMMDNPEAAVNLAKMVAKQPGPPIELNTMADLFLQRNMVREATAFLLEVLQDNKPEHDKLQTKVRAGSRSCMPRTRLLLGLQRQACLLAGLFTGLAVVCFVWRCKHQVL